MRRSDMRLNATSWVLAATIALAACGTLDGADSARDELKSFLDDDDVDGRWESIDTGSAADINVAVGRPEVAAVTWTSSSFTGERVIEAVGGSTGCDDDCLDAAETWARNELAARLLPTAISNGPCFMCESEEFVTLVSVDEVSVQVVEPAEVAAVVGEVDTAYEAVLVTGMSARVRPAGDGWRMIVSRITSDCDPFVVTHTMQAVDRVGSREQLATVEASDNSCI
ncbi:MAG: hypothetical protein HKN41_04130 [Ilumatobacter sp.]|nr:hypothetical protein [Ilumatobacter sp.]